MANAKKDVTAPASNPPVPPVTPPTEPKFAVNSVMNCDGVVDGELQWTFRTLGKIRFALDAANATIKRDGYEHGMTQKIGDKAANVKGEAAKFAIMEAEAARLSKPDATWNATERAKPVDTFFEDLVSVFADTDRKMPDGTTAKLGAEKARTYLAAKTEPERLALSRADRYASRFDALRAARFAAVDTAKMAAEIDNL